ncbi:MAG: glycosyltransferase family 2 protein [Actinobacteria bacterium]|nr:glycosyltransferase family 2 protein [Actinomycetota bacterium]
MPARFSLIIPAHDAAATLGVALDTVASQVREFDDVIVVADCCRDDTAEIARGAGATVIVSRKGHPGLARNAGLDAATGDYVLFLDADDWYVRDDALARLEHRIEETGSPDILHFGFMWGSEPASAFGWRAHAYGCVWARAWSRHAIGGIRFAAEAMAEDLAFCRRVFAKPLHHETLDEVLLQYVFPSPTSYTGRWIAAGRPSAG